MFQSEHSFDATGFEATHALAKHALHIEDRSGENKTGISLKTERFMQSNLPKNIFCAAGADLHVSYVAVTIEAFHNLILAR